MSKPTIMIDASQLDLFLLCEVRYNYRYIQNKTQREKAVALDKGSLVHLGLETYYKALAGGTKFTDAVDTMMLAVSSDASSNQMEMDDINLVKNTLIQNTEYHRLTDQNLEILFVEEPFAYILYEDDYMRIMMTGKIDLIVNDHPRYTNLPFDHKSMERNWPTKRLSNQFQNYCYATGSNYLVVNKVGFQKTLKPEEKFLRVPLSYDHVILEQWKVNTISVIKRYLDCVAEDSWHMNFTSCDKFNRLCEYYDVCDTSGDENKVHKLNTFYAEGEKWDVTKVLKKDDVVS